MSNEENARMHHFFLQTSNILVLPPRAPSLGDVSGAPGHNRNVPLGPPPQAVQVQTLHGEVSDQIDDSSPHHSFDEIPRLNLLA